MRMLGPLQQKVLRSTKNNVTGKEVVKRVIGPVPFHTRGAIVGNSHFDSLDSIEEAAAAHWTAMTQRLCPTVSMASGLPAAAERNTTVGENAVMRRPHQSVSLFTDAVMANRARI